MNAQSIGLLVCDHIHPNFRHLEDSYPSMFRRLLPNTDLIPYYVCDGQFPQNVTDHYAYLCTGSRHSVYDDIDWVKKLTGFVKSIHHHTKKFVGICFGHQLIAHALGGRVEKAAVGWCVGIHHFEVISHQSWMTPAIAEHMNLMLCQDQVVRLPGGSEVLSKGTQCEIGMFRVGKHMLGIQAHPEFTKAFNRAIITHRQALIGEKRVNEAYESLKSPLKNDIIGSWILNFINS